MRRLAIALLLSFAAAKSHAMSCSPMEERYYFSCVKGACTAEFRAMPFRFGNTCGRRDRVEPIPADIAGYLVPLIAESQPAVGDGVYSMRFKFPWWDYRGSDSLAQFEKNLRRDYAFSDKRAQAPIREQGSASPAAIKERILQESRDQSHKELARTAACWGLFLVLLGLLGYSVRAFYMILAMERSKARTKRLAAVLAVQVAVLMTPLLGFVTTFFFFFILFFDCLVILLLSPAVVLAWLLEIFWVVRRKISIRA